MLQLIGRVVDRLGFLEPVAGALQKQVGQTVAGRRWFSESRKDVLNGSGSRPGCKLATTDIPGELADRKRINEFEISI
jgi:hypothetical protein